MKKDNWEDYFIDGTNVLKNKFNIIDEGELEKKEKEITLKKLSYLNLFPIKGNFDEEHLRQIHKFLFNEIYPFAGEYRKCTMAKTTRNFYDPEIIEDMLNKTLDKMNEEIKNITSVRMYSFFLSKAYYDLMTIHPFREGNGRSVREFLREFVLDKNKILPFEDVLLDFTKMNKDNFLLSVEQRYLYPSLLEEEFFKALVPAKLKKEKNSKII